MAIIPLKHNAHNTLTQLNIAVYNLSQIPLDEIINTPNGLENYTRACINLVGIGELIIKDVNQKRGQE